MPDTERELLRDHQARTVPVVPAWLALPLGVALVAGGVALVLVGAGALPVVPRSDVPPAVPYSVGVVFAVVGAWLIAVKLGDGLRRARARRLRRSLPGALWLADHPWNPAGAWDETGQRALWGFVFATLLGVFLVPFNWVAFGTAAGVSVYGSVVSGVVTGVFDVLTVIVIGHAVYLATRRWKYGAVFLRFERFPFRLGGSLRVWLRVPRPPAECRRLTITLRCIEERYETRAGDESTWTASYQLHADRLEIDPAWGRMAGQWNVPVTFMLPAAPLETSLSARHPRYWELAVHGESLGRRLRRDVPRAHLRANVRLGPARWMSWTGWEWPPRHC